jgi:hypothetical protein
MAYARGWWSGNRVATKLALAAEMTANPHLGSLRLGGETFFLPHETAGYRRTYALAGCAPTGGGTATLGLDLICNAKPAAINAMKPPAKKAALYSPR